MKRAIILTSVLVSVGGFAACAVEPEAPTITPTAGTGGAGPTAGMGGSVMAGTGGTATGGTAGAATGGTGGSVTAGTGGSTGGMAGTGTGGSTAGMAGMAGTGNTAGMSGAGGSGAGMAGMAGTGNTGGQSAGGMSGAAGTAAGMSGAGGGGSGVPTISELVGALDGHLIITPCGDEPNTDDCAGGGWRSSAVNNGANNICQGGRLEANITIPVGGTPGTEYDVTMHFYGIMEPRQYSNVTREASGDPNLNGGTPYPWADADGNPTITGSGDQNYNTYEIHVYDDMDQAVHSYFINADNGTGHYTMLIDYEKTIQLIGGGEVRLRVFDQNCRQIKNCGASGGTPCANKARTVDIGEADPQPGQNPPLDQPALGNNGGPEHSGQWWLIDVTEVALAN